jgi:carboxymethylenebutenolidase
VIQTCAGGLARVAACVLLAAVSSLWLPARAAPAQQVPETVEFMSRDGTTMLVGYLYHPRTPGPHPALVMLHGRGGPYSSLKRGTYTAETLTARHRLWGNFWAGLGYLALHVDSFRPRGYPDGFPRHSYRERPPEVSERTARPLDAYGALDYLRARADVIVDRIGIQGWSNGGMTVLSTLDSEPPGFRGPTPATAFRAALALYPSCRTQARQDGYRTYAPLLILVATADDEVSPRVCERFAQEARARGVEVELVSYLDAHHSYDDPGRTKQSHAPNRLALQDSLRRAQEFFDRHLRGQGAEPGNREGKD